MPDINLQLGIADWAWVCTALLALLVPALGFYVSINRGKTRTNYHYKPDPADPLYRAVRIHGNTTEYVPTAILLILATAVLVPGQVAMWLAILLTAARYSLVAGMLLSPSLDKPNLLRIIGSAGTYFIGIGQALWLLWAAAS